MFRGCDILGKVTIYAQDIAASGCLDNWLAEVAKVLDVDVTELLWHTK